MTGLADGAAAAQLLAQLGQKNSAVTQELARFAKLRFSRCKSYAERARLVLG